MGGKVELEKIKDINKHIVSGFYNFNIHISR